MVRGRSKMFWRQFAAVAITLVLGGLAVGAGTGLSQGLTQPVKAASLQLTPTICPIPTPELFYVEPLTSPTNALSQTVRVHLGRADGITITLESGVFTAPGSGPVEVGLLPNTTHHLSVVGRVADFSTAPGCNFSGYSLSTTVDRNGKPLVIVQQEGALEPELYMPVLAGEPPASAPSPTFASRTPTATSDPSASTPPPTPEPSQTPSPSPSAGTSSHTPTPTSTATAPPPTATMTTTPALPPPDFVNCATVGDPERAPNFPLRIAAIDKHAEEVTLRNTSASAVNLAGWRMCSVTGGQTHAISGTLAPGEVRTFARSGGPIWNNTQPDPGALWNPAGQLVSYWPD